uniref:Uncharacterized protein n=1 Tax=Anguilla anguilla TaxID=7936 RepID=A0A0E9UQ07_ANGAN
MSVIWWKLIIYMCLIIINTEKHKKKLSHFRIHSKWSQTIFCLPC